MQYIIIGAVLGLCFFAVPILAYERGVRMGMRMTKGIEPAQIRSPTAVIEQRKEAKEVKVQEDALTKGITNLFSYTGKIQAGGE